MFFYLKKNLCVALHPYNQYYQHNPIFPLTDKYENIRVAKKSHLSLTFAFCYGLINTDSRNLHLMFVDVLIYVHSK